MRDVLGDSLLVGIQPLADLAIGQPFRNQGSYLHLKSSQVIGHQQSPYPVDPRATVATKVAHGA